MNIKKHMVLQQIKQKMITIDDILIDITIDETFDEQNNFAKKKLKHLKIILDQETLSDCNGTRTHNHLVRK